jgi:hypothetical protein
MFKIFSRIFVEYIFKMQRMEVSGAVRHTYMSLGGKGLRIIRITGNLIIFEPNRDEVTGG